MACMKVKGGSVESCNVFEIYFLALLRTNYCCELIFKTVPCVDFCHKVTEAILHNRQPAASSALPSDIRHLTKDRQLQPSHQGISCDIYIESFCAALKGWNKSQMALDSSSCLSWYCDLCHSYFICWLVSLMWRLIPKMQSSCRRKQLIVPLPSRFFWAFRLFHHVRDTSLWLRFHCKSLRTTFFCGRRGSEVQQCTGDAWGSCVNIL